MKLTLPVLVFLFSSFFASAQTVCNANANVVLYSNYDGGVLNINCDVNIPNLKIGVVSYEMVTINLTGPFVSNVTAVQFAGYVTTTHQHCNNTPPATSIVGAPPGTDTIVFMPPSPLSNPNGYGIIICNTSCDTSSGQGGCNTADQVAAYFLQQFGGDLRFHYTQYGCWTGSYNISAGGNCCIGAVASAPVPVSALQASDTSFCDKKCIDFTDLSTNSPTSWQWYFPGADTVYSTLQNPTNICYNSYGSFDVTLIACNIAGCDTLYLPGFINEYQNPPVPVITGNFDTLFCSPSFLYQWYGNTGLIAGATDPYYVYQQQGSYFVVITDSNGCAASSNVIYTGIDNHDDENWDVILLPNPNNGQFEIRGIGNMYHMPTCDIHDLTGRCIMHMEWQNMSSALHVNLGLVSDGLYFMSFKTGQNVLNKKLMVTHATR